MPRPDTEKKDFRVAVGAEPADRAISPIRADLKISPQLFYGQLCFVVKDPVTLRYFRLQPIEHFLVSQFDGKKTARDLLALLQQQFPESALTVQDVLRFVGMLHESHLLVGEGVAHAEWLSKRASASRRRRALDLASNFLFLKMPLFNPQRVLNFLETTFGRFIFHPTTGAIAIALVLLASWMMAHNVDRLVNLPYSLLSWQNLIILYGVFIVTKVFHEFGHGMAARHFGGEVSQMGVLLFVFTPSFYCDTSDAWMIPSRAARLWINAGGVVVELVLAALASFVWLNTPVDGLLNQIALNVMISCSVATLFFNANPLLKYDGYYFLADLLEIPNLYTKGRQFITYYMQKYLLGLKPQMPPDRRRLGWLIAYAAASGVYRWFVFFGIITLLYFFFEQYGLGPLGVLLAVAYVALTVLLPVSKAVRFLWKQRWDVSRRLAYAGGAAAVGLGALALVAILPWKHTLRQPMVILSEQDEPITVRTPGRIESVGADAGQAVKAGDVIVRLVNPELDILLRRAIANRDLADLNARNAQAEKKLAAYAAARNAAEAYEKQVESLQKQREDLVLKAPIDGVVVREHSLHQITGTEVTPGTRLCRVIRTDALQARISLPQQEASLVKNGMPVRIRLWSDPDVVIRSKVARVSSTLSDQLLHPALASTVKGDVDVKPDAKGEARSVGRRSTVVIDLPRPEGMFLADGMTGRAEIVVERTTVARRIWRLILDSTTPDWHL